jgi:hypothetical protein
MGDPRTDRPDQRRGIEKVLSEPPRDQKVMQVYKEISGFVALPPD